MKKKNLCFLNRQPTLWRHGIVNVDVLPEDDENLTIALSPYILEQLNADFDGIKYAAFTSNRNRKLR